MPCGAKVQLTAWRADGGPCRLNPLWTLQLSADGGSCFEAEYQPGDFVKNDANQFSANGGAPAP